MSHSMLQTEWRLLVRDRALATLLVILVAACAYGIYNGASMVRDQAATTTAVLEGARAEQEEQRARMEEGMERQRQQREALPEAQRAALPPLRAMPNTPGTQHAVLPPAPLGVLATGQTDLAGFYTPVSTRQRTITPVDELDNPVHLMAGRFDLTFVLLLLYPLLIMGLLFNLLSGEREQGTLRLLAAQPVRMTKVMWSKLAVRCAVVAAVPLLIAAGAVVFADAGPARALLWLATALCYGAFWVAVSLLVNAYGRTSAGNAAVLLAVWLLVIVGVPAAQQMLVSVTHPAPSEITLVATMRAAQDDANERGDELVNNLYFEHPELMPPQGEEDARRFQNRRLAIDLYIQKAIQPVIDTFERSFSQRQSLAQRYRFLSPALTAQAALEDVTGTGTDRQRSFRQQIGAFQKQWNDYTRMAAEDPQRTLTAPRFEFREEPLSAITARVMPGLLVMLVLAGILAAVASRRLSRVSQLL